MKTTLNNKVGTPSTNSEAWTSYGYYKNSNIYYTDVVLDGAKYRGVYFTTYRQTYIDNTVYNADNSIQDNNGYSTSTVYWFRFDPIEWTILAEQDGKALILCNMIIDAQEFDSSNGTFNSNYAESTIKAWLNDVFYNTAFNDLQKAIIINSFVDNGKEVADYTNGNPFLCDDTYDNIFLLSRGEVKNSSYGFDDAATRAKKTTSYAKALGAYADNDGYGHWLLRTPFCESNSDTDDTIIHRIKPNGVIDKINTYVTTGGIVPAMWISLDADDDQTPEGGENPEIPENPDPENPEIPDPEIPDPENPDPENPETPDPETPEEPNEPEIIDVTFNTVFGSYNLNNKNDNSTFLDANFASEILKGVEKRMGEGARIDVLGIQRATSKARFEALVAEVQALDSSYQYSYFFEGADGNIGFISRVPFENARVITGESGFKFGVAEMIFEAESGDKVAINFYVCNFDANKLDAQIKDLDAELEGKSNYFIAGCFATSDYTVFEELPSYGNVNSTPVDTFRDGKDNTVTCPDGMLYNTDSWSDISLRRGHTAEKDTPNGFNRYLCFTEATYNGTITRTAE